MNAPGSSKVVERAIKDYHAKIAEYDDARIVHELGRRLAFQALLENTAKPMAGWQVISEKPVVIHKGKSIRPDGLLRDEYGLRRGFWEAKDKADDLEKEIRAKIAGGYPTENIIFEDTHTAILFQDGKRLPAFDLKNPIDVRHLLDTFYKHTAKVIEEFNQAIAQFKENIPELGEGLKSIIMTARAEKPEFRAAFDDFLQVCRDAINPTLRDDAVVEMVIQHLMTERIIRRVFNNPEFNHRNVIAREIENMRPRHDSRERRGTSFGRSAGSPPQTGVL